MVMCLEPFENRKETVNTPRSGWSIRANRKREKILSISRANFPAGRWSKRS